MNGATLSTNPTQLIPAETQLLMERVFIAGFALCLVFLVFCGCAIGVEAYFLSTQAKLPPDLDDFIVNVRIYKWWKHTTDGLCSSCMQRESRRTVVNPQT